MNIKGQGHFLTLLQVLSDSTFLNFFSLETARPIEAKFHVESPWGGGMFSESEYIRFMSHDQDGRHVHIL